MCVVKRLRSVDSKPSFHLLSVRGAAKVPERAGDRFIGCELIRVFTVSTVLVIKLVVLSMVSCDFGLTVSRRPALVVSSVAFVRHLNS